jgi:hypothetical protein
MTSTREKTEYLFSGTLGDAYIALCKLDSRPGRAPCSLRRLCQHSGSDNAISEVAALFDGVEYLPDFIKFDSILEMRDYAFKHADRYVNIFWDGKGHGNEPDDPPELGYSAHPEIKLRRPTLAMRKRHVGIQLHSGSRRESPRRLSVSWVLELCRLLAHSEIGVFVLGTGEGYAAEEIELLRSMPAGAASVVGSSTVTEWLGYIAAVDYLITPDGLASFFSLSQKVPTLMLFQEQFALLRLHPLWRENALCLHPQVEMQSSDSTWVPFAAEQMATLLLARFDPEAAPAAPAASAAPAALA